MREIAVIFEIGHLVAHRRRADPQFRVLAHAARADRRGRFDVFAHHEAQYLLPARRQNVNSLAHFSTLNPRVLK